MKRILFFSLAASCLFAQDVQLVKVDQIVNANRANEYCKNKEMRLMHVDELHIYLVSQDTGNRFFQKVTQKNSKQVYSDMANFMLTQESPDYVKADEFLCTSAKQELAKQKILGE
jgi:hypothetical protein